MANAKDAPIGSGIAKMASNKVAIEKLYKKYVIEAQTGGEDPMPLDAFIKKMQEDQKAENDAFEGEMKS